jgi:shikimate 5-dehydrogenase
MGTLRLVGSRLLGHVAFVLAGRGGAEEAVTRAVAQEGATVVVVASDAEEGGRLARDLRDAGTRRVAVFCTGDDPQRDAGALVGLVADLSSQL